MPTQPRSVDCQSSSECVRAIVPLPDREGFTTVVQCRCTQACAENFGAINPQAVMLLAKILQNTKGSGTEVVHKQASPGLLAVTFQQEGYIGRAINSRMLLIGTPRLLSRPFQVPRVAASSDLHSVSYTHLTLPTKA